MAENKKRWKIQAAAALFTNPLLSNFISGKLFKGWGKAVCVPGLNCYSCPGAAASCPIGAIQAVVGSSKFSFAYYAVGLVLFFGALLGRLVCGFLCPFGWFQDLLHKIPAKKLSTRRLRPLRYLKYVLLVLFVLILPMTVVNEVGMGSPFFCKYLCPAGILGGGLPLAAVNPGIRASLGVLFTWKSCLLLFFTLMSIFFYRPFCKWFCPLGAMYGMLNKVSMYRYTIAEDRCTRCGACARVCKMDVAVYKTPNHSECIRCGDCMKTCPHAAICPSFSIKNQKNRNDTEAFND